MKNKSKKSVMTITKKQLKEAFSENAFQKGSLKSFLRKTWQGTTLFGTEIVFLADHLPEKLHVKEVIEYEGRFQTTYAFKNFKGRVLFKTRCYFQRYSYL